MTTATITVPCDRATLVARLTLAASAIRGRTALPALGMLRLQAVDGVMYASSTNMDECYRVPLGHVAGTADGVVDWKLFKRLLVGLAGQVVFTIEAETMTITDGHWTRRIAFLNGDKLAVHTAQCDKADKALVKGLEMPVVDTVRFIRAAERIVRFASTDDARPVLCGISFQDDEGEVSLVATDSYRLATAIFGAATPEGFPACLIPAAAVKALVKAEKARRFIPGGAMTVTVAKDGSYMRIHRDGGPTVTAKRIEGTFPNWKGLVPTSVPHTLVGSGAEMAALITAAKPYSEDHVPLTLTFNADGVVCKVTRNGETHTIGSLPGFKTAEGEIVIAFNNKYLGDTLAALGDGAIQIELAGPLKPGLFCPIDDDDFLALNMPVRL